jgi:hypothetical protein
VPLVHRGEQTAELLPAGDWDEPLGLRCERLGEYLGRQQAGVLAEADEEEAIQELLGLFQQPDLMGLGLIGTRRRVVAPQPFEQVQT